MRIQMQCVFTKKKEKHCQMSQVKEAGVANEFKCASVRAPVLLIPATCLVCWHN